MRAYHEKILLSILIFIINFCTLQAMEQKQPKEFLTLIAKDKETSFDVPLEIARKSLRINNYLASMEEQANTCKGMMGTDIPAPLLDYFAASMQSFYKHKNLKGKHLFDAVYKDLAAKAAPGIPEDAGEGLKQLLKLYHSPALVRLQKTFPFGLCTALFNLAIHYEFKPLFELMGRELVQFMLAQPDIFKEIKKRIRVPNIWQPELARWYYLLTGKNITGYHLVLNETAYGFSLRELLDYQRLHTAVDANGKLFLNNLNLTDLDGLQEIPNITICTSLVLSVNNLTTLPSSIFAGLAQLQTLHLDNNQLNTLPSDIFTGLAQLKALYLGHNRLNTLPSGIFTDLIQLSNLFLDNNQLSTLPSNIFTDLVQLKILYLHNNQLTKLLPGTFTGLVQLIHLNLGYNKLNALPTDLFAGLVQLQSLSLDANLLSMLPSGIFTGLDQLMRLNLGRNKLSILPVDIFANLVQLQSLSLAYNQLSTLPVSIFANLTQLITLSLNNNQLSTLPVGIFANLARLQALHLDNNQLNTLPVGIFAELAQLQELYLHNNQLSALSSNIFTGLTRLQWLFLGRNQLSEENKEAIRAALPRNIVEF